MKASNKKPIDGLGQERRNSSALAMKLCLSCIKPLQWRHNGHYSVSNHQPHDCLLNHLFRRISKKTSKLRVTGLCAGKSLATGEFPAQMASNVENVSIWWCHHAIKIYQCKTHWGHWWRRLQPTSSIITYAKSVDSNLVDFERKTFLEQPGILHNNSS